MRSDPKPAHVTLNLDSKRSVMRAHAHRPEPADLLEVKRRVPGIRFEEFVVLVGEITDIDRERAVERPEPARCVMLQISRALPAL